MSKHLRFFFEIWFEIFVSLLEKIETQIKEAAVERYYDRTKTELKRET
jgi:hypothetical protein